MEPERKILIAIDTSEDSKRAVEYALSNIIRPEKDQVLLLNARALIPMAFPGAGSDYMVAPDVWSQIQKHSEEESEQLLKSYMKTLNDAKVKCKGITVEGDPRDVILEEANKHKVNLVILGSRGLSAVKRAVLGSVSGHIVNSAKAPTLIVRGHKEKEEGKHRTVVFAVDESETSKHALRWALENVCHSTTDQLIIMTAQPLTSWTAYSEFTTLEMEEKLEKEGLDRKRNLLLSLNDEAKKFGAHCVMEIVRGDAREAVLWAVEKYNADMLVMGNRGLSTFSRMFLGSVSSYCCHNVKCPILVVKPDPPHADEEKQDAPKPMPEVKVE